MEHKVSLRANVCVALFKHQQSVEKGERRLKWASLQRLLEFKKVCVLILHTFLSRIEERREEKKNSRKFCVFKVHGGLFLE